MKPLRGSVILILVARRGMPASVGFCGGEGGGVEQVINIFGVFVEHFFGYVGKNVLLCRK